jgi:hypothetical protein
MPHPADLSAQRTTPFDAGQPAGQGLQGGWPIDDDGILSFPHSLQSQLPVIVDAGAVWLRLNFRLGGRFENWTAAGAEGENALAQYDILVDDALTRGLKVLGLLSPESWRGSQDEWTAGNAENAGGNGDNAYLEKFAQQAAAVLIKHFDGRIGVWQVWNEPNAWATNAATGVYTGGTFIYPSNFAWLLRRIYEAAHRSGASGLTFVSGGVFGHDIVGLADVIEGRRVVLHGDYRAACPQRSSTYVSTRASGADYLTDTYEEGLSHAGWQSTKSTWGSYPLDAVGQHLYIDQSRKTSSASIAAYLDDLRQAYVAFEGAGTMKKTIVTEVGWTTSAVSSAVQSYNLKVSYTAFKRVAYLANAFWFSIQDIPESNLYFGLQSGGSARDGYKGKPKPSFSTHRAHVAF